MTAPLALIFGVIFDITVLGAMHKRVRCARRLPRDAAVDRDVSGRCNTNHQTEQS